jgi:hypothetical protein
VPIAQIDVVNTTVRASLTQLLGKLASATGRDKNGLSHWTGRTHTFALKMQSVITP